MGNDVFDTQWLKATLAEIVAETLPLEPGTYRCSTCKKVYNKTVSDEEAEQEMRSFFGNVPKEDQCLVCDYCWNKIHPARN